MILGQYSTGSREKTSNKSTDIKLTASVSNCTPEFNTIETSLIPAEININDTKFVNSSSKKCSITGSEKILPMNSISKHDLVNESSHNNNSPTISLTMNKLHITPLITSSQNGNKKVILNRKEINNIEEDQELSRAKAIALSASRIIHNQKLMQQQSSSSLNLTSIMSAALKKKTRTLNTVDPHINFDQAQRYLIEEERGRAISNDFFIPRKYEKKNTKVISQMALGEGIREAALKAKEKVTEAFRMDQLIGESSIKTIINNRDAKVDDTVQNISLNVGVLEKSIDTKSDSSNVSQISFTRVNCSGNRKYGVNPRMSPIISPSEDNESNYQNNVVIKNSQKLRLYKNEIKSEMVTSNSSQRECMNVSDSQSVSCLSVGNLEQIQITDSCNEETNSTQRHSNMSSVMLKDFNRHHGILSSIVWKRRSGFGKYSLTKAWEKRRLTLQENKLQYFKSVSGNFGETESDNVFISVGEVGYNGAGSLNTQTQYTSRLDVIDDSILSRNNNSFVENNKVSSSQVSFCVKSKRLDNIRQIWSQASLHFRQAQESIKEHFTLPLHPLALSKEDMSDCRRMSGDVTARGVIDLVKEHATIAISSPAFESSSLSMGGRSTILRTIGTNIAAPTPFSLTIFTKSNETRWKFCFETQHEQMKWVAALMEVVVGESVRDFNEYLSIIDDKDSFVGLNIPRGLKNSNERFSWDQKYSVCNIHGLLCNNFDNIKAKKVQQNIIQIKNEENLTPVKASSKYVYNNSNPSNSSIYCARNFRFSMSLRGQSLFCIWIIVHTTLFYHSSTWITFLLSSTVINYAIWLVVVEEDSMLTAKWGRNNSSPVSFTNDFSTERVNATRPSLFIYNNKTSIDMKTEFLNKKIQRLSAGYKPVAGSTTMQIQHSDYIPMHKGHRYIGWLPLKSQFIQVRSHGYLTFKKKVPCPTELYRILKVDIFETEKWVPDVSTRVKLPLIEFEELDDVGCTGVNSTKWYSPDIFVVSVSVPTSTPKLCRSSDDGKGITIIIYYQMKNETRKILRRISAVDYQPDLDCSEEDMDKQLRITNGVRLFDEWCKQAPNDPKFQGRFKFVASAHNLEEIGLSGWIAKYCGKPVLVKRRNITGFLHSHPELNAMEFDINIHPFPYVAKQATAYLSEYIFSKALINLSFIIEGRSDNELPEVLIGETVQICYPDLTHVINGNQLFTGTSPSSVGHK